MRRTLMSVFALAVLVAALWYAVWPPRTDEGYRHQAEQSVAKLHSQVATAQLWGRELDRDHAFLRTVSLGLDEMESDATSTVDQFAAYSPPARYRSLRSSVTALGSKVEARLSELRIAARSGRVDEVVQLAARLDPLLADLEGLEQEVGG